MNWNDLSMAERTTYIKLGLDNNITDLKIVRDTYNKYAEGGKKPVGPTYNKRTKAWYNSRGQKLIYGNGYWSDRAKVYTQYNSDGTVSKFTPAQWNKKKGKEVIEPRKVDFSLLTIDNNRGRKFNIEHMQQLQDSMINRGYREPQRLAILGTSLQEINEKGSSTRGVGGNGFLGLSFERMPERLLEKGKTGDQIHYILNDLESVHPNNWNEGGSGGPYINNGYSGYKSFWDAKDAEEATLYLNKSYVRPRDREPSWNNRAKLAEFLKSLYTK